MNRLVGVAFVGTLCANAVAQLSIGSQFTASGGGIGLAFDHTDNTVWRYAGSSTVQHYTASGTVLATIPRPGEVADDADLEITTVAMTLNTTPLPAGTLLFINGESGSADIYAVNKSTGAVLATLVTGFGVSHVVGGAVHPSRGTIFLVQDKVPSNAAERSRVAEIDPRTGAVLNTFQITTALPSFTVNFGDIDVAINGNLLIASSDELSIAEFTPAGALVQQLALPAGVSGLCGIGVDEGNCEVWVASTSTGVWRLGVPGGDSLCVPTCAADFDHDGFVTGDDFDAYVSAFELGDPGADFDHNGFVTGEDFDAFVLAFEAGC